MKIEKNSTEIIQEYMVYYLNGERFASSTMQGGKRAYTIENYDRRLYVENSKDIFSKEKENILDKLDIGTLMYENLVHTNYYRNCMFFLNFYDIYAASILEYTSIGV